MATRPDYYKTLGVGKNASDEEITAKTNALNEAFHKVSEAMYQRAQEQAAATGATDGAGEGGEASTNGAGAEDVVDAEVVDEGK